MFERRRGRWWRTDIGRRSGRTGSPRVVGSGISHTSKGSPCLGGGKDGEESGALGSHLERTAGNMVHLGLYAIIEPK
jgi:hypothetical protein